MKTAIQLRDYLLELIKEESETSLERLKEVGDQNSWMAGAYQGEIDAYSFITERLNETLLEVTPDDENFNLKEQIQSLEANLAIAKKALEHYATPGIHERWRAEEALAQLEGKAE